MLWLSKIFVLRYIETGCRNFLFTNKMFRIFRSFQFFQTLKKQVQLNSLEIGSSCLNNCRIWCVHTLTAANPCKRGFLSMPTCFFFPSLLRNGPVWKLFCIVIFADSIGLQWMWTRDSTHSSLIVNQPYGSRMNTPAQHLRGMCSRTFPFNWKRSSFIWIWQ